MKIVLHEFRLTSTVSGKTEARPTAVHRPPPRELPPTLPPTPPALPQRRPWPLNVLGTWQELRQHGREFLFWLSRSKLSDIISWLVLNVFSLSILRNGKRTAILVCHTGLAIRFSPARFQCDSRDSVSCELFLQSATTSGHTHRGWKIFLLDSRNRFLIVKERWILS